MECLWQRRPSWAAISILVLKEMLRKVKSVRATLTLSSLAGELHHCLIPAHRMDLGVAGSARVTVAPMTTVKRAYCAFHEVKARLLPYQAAPQVERAISLVWTIATPHFHQPQLLPPLQQQRRRLRRQLRQRLSRWRRCTPWVTWISLENVRKASRVERARVIATMICSAARV